MKQLQFIFCTAISLLFINNACADTSIKSHFGFEATLPEGWIIINPNMPNDSIKTSDFPPGMDNKIAQLIKERLQNGNIEFYYDINYLEKENPNHINIQKGPAIIITSDEVVKSYCKLLPAKLGKIYGEMPIMHSCNMLKNYKYPIFNHSYTINSANLTIINDSVPINSEQSLIVTSSSSNDKNGRDRLKKVRRIIVNAISDTSE